MADEQRILRTAVTIGIIFQLGMLVCDMCVCVCVVCVPHEYVWAGLLVKFAGRAVQSWLFSLPRPHARLARARGPFL